MRRAAALVALAALCACSSDEPAGDHDAGPTPADTGPMSDAPSDLDAGPARPERASHYPIEVVGTCPDDGSPCNEVLVTLELEAPVAIGPAELLLTTHNIVQSSSAEVVINAAHVVPLSAPDGPFLRRHGGVSSGVIAIPDGALRAGANELVFRYTRQVPDVSGYRVLHLAVSAGESVVDLDLPLDDPSTWRAYDGSAEAIERGRAFFESVSRDGGPACARCHTDSGSDLAYFAFSNGAIVERSRFHLFPLEEARDIASFLRSSEQPVVGTIFDPPFQPGPSNHGAAGAGYRAVVDDDAFGLAAFGASGIADDVAWDWASGVDPYALPAPVQMPSWFRWLPRVLDDEWLARAAESDGTTLAELERALRDDPSQESARRFMSGAVAIGKELFAEDRAHDRIDLLRFAAVKLWEQSRVLGFGAAHHGFPDGTPPYPYEVGFAFFESADSIEDGYLQTMEWWWAQIVLDPGRGASDGRRPLNWGDVLIAAEGAGLGPNAIAFLHLYGSWEESRGPMEARWGESVGPARLLEIPMRHLPVRERAALMRRFMREESTRVAAGVVLERAHLDDVERAWAAGCVDLEAATLAELRMLAPAQTRAVMTACP